MVKSGLKKVALLLSVGNYETQEVPDPYYGGDNGFEMVYHLINNACNTIAEGLNWNIN